MTVARLEPRSIPRFDRAFFESPEPITRIGDGEIGGKAHGLVEIRNLLSGGIASAGEIQIDVPKMAILTTDVFDAFVSRNDLQEMAFSDQPDHRKCQAFLEAQLPAEIVGDLRGLIDGMHSPLAIRSSSLLEDSLFRPFAGVYRTKMVPNSQPDADTRFLCLTEAIKFVYA